MCMAFRCRVCHPVQIKAVKGVSEVAMKAMLRLQPSH